MKKSFLVLSFFLAFFAFTEKPVAAADNQPKRVVFINQVRGSECCDSGDFLLFKMQFDALALGKMPVGFALRFDTLFDQKYQAALKQDKGQLFELGAFLEITPSLAKKAGVAYSGTPETWFQAHHVYTVGYELDDRKKIVDTYMADFKSAFGFYPKFVTAWMLDTPTATYIKDTYNISIFQITREQWGTDSYTLSGGPIHYPFEASRSWIFQPLQPDETSSGLLVLRQTGSDPLLNYGDPTSAFTTQPNDYARDGKDFSYFDKLASNLLSQRQNKYSFLLLGLENSMPKDVQSAFVEQISWIQEKKKSDPQLSVVSPSEFYEEFYRQEWNAMWPQVVSSSDLTSKTDSLTTWVTTPLYRARFLHNNIGLQLTDYRVYSKNQIDPYTSRVAKNNAYWVIPFVVDGSRFYEERSLAKGGFLNNFKQILKNAVLPENAHDQKEPQVSRNDTTSIPLSILLSNEKNSEDALALLSFDTEGFSVSSNLDKTLYKSMSLVAEHSSFLQYSKANNTHSLSWKFPSVGLTLTCRENSCLFTPKIEPGFSFSELLEQYYGILLPEVVTRPISSEKSILYAHNPHAIAGQNPIRLVFIPKDQYGFSTGLEGDPFISTEPKVITTSIKRQQSHSGVIFIDIVDQRPGLYAVSVETEDGFKKNVRVAFAPNCREKVTYCLTHPRQTLWYVQAKLMTRLRDW